MGSSICELQYSDLKLQPMKQLTGTSKAPRPSKGAPDETDYVPLRKEHSIQGVFSWMHQLYVYGGEKGSDIGAEGFKNTVTAWSTTYYVAYALFMTVAFAMVCSAPEPYEAREHARRSRLSGIIHYKFGQQEDIIATIDDVVVLLYYLFVALACYYSSWGMWLTSQWGVRGPTPPAAVFEKFLEQVCRADKGTRYLEFNCGCIPMLTAKSDSWDPIYFYASTVGFMFLAMVMYLYVSQGAMHASCMLVAFLLYKRRCEQYGDVLFEAACATLDELELKESEEP